MIRASFGLFLLVAAASASAQIDNGLPGPQPFDAGGFILRDAMFRLNLSKATGGGRKGGGRKAAAPKPTPIPTTAYKSSPAVTAGVKRKYVEFVKGRYGAKVAEETRRWLAQNDFVAVWKSAVKEDGLREGNVADALTAYWVANWTIANGASENTRDQVQGLRRQIVPIALGTPAFRKLGDAERQEMAESLMLNLVVQMGAYGTALQKGDADLKRKLSDAAAVRFRDEVGLDLRSLTLTGEGLGKRD